MGEFKKYIGKIVHYYFQAERRNYTFLIMGYSINDGYVLINNNWIPSGFLIYNQELDCYYLENYDLII